MSGHSKTIMSKAFDPNGRRNDKSVCRSTRRSVNKFESIVLTFNCRNGLNSASAKIRFLFCTGKSSSESRDI